MDLQDIGNMDLAYAGAPYTALNADGTEDKAMIAERMRVFMMCLASLTRRGIKVCSPLLMDGVRKHDADIPGDWKYWGDYSTVMLEKCNVLIIIKIPGWDKSSGVAGEIQIAKVNRIPVIYIDPVELIGEAGRISNKNQIDDGAILVRVSKIKNTFVRRLAIAASIIPITAINILLVGVAIPKALLGNTVIAFRSAKKHW